MKLTEERTTLVALPAVFDMQEFVTLEILACSERSITNVTIKGRLFYILELSNICLTGGELPTIFTDTWPFSFMHQSVFHKL